MPIDISTWTGWLAPAGTPAPVLGRLHAVLSKVAKSQEVAKVIESDGGIGVGSTPEEFQKFLAQQGAHWRKVIRDAGLRF